jgi:hypothetical protein
MTPKDLDHSTYMHNDAMTMIQNSLGEAVQYKLGAAAAAGWIEAQWWCYLVLDETHDPDYARARSFLAERLLEHGVIP